MMFHKKRLLKKEKAKNRFKYVILFEILFFLLILTLEFFYFNLFLGSNAFLSPLARNKSSQVLVLEKELVSANVPFMNIVQNNDTSFTVKLKDGGEVILSSKKSMHKQITSLQLILSRLTIEGKRLKSLNFKFANPVVTF